MPVYKEPSLEIKSAGLKGRGVFTKKSIKAGKLFLRNETIALSPGDTHFVESSILGRYIFGSDHRMDPFSYLAVGHGSLLNHSDDPNTEFRLSEGPHGKMVVFTALRNIKAGEEITIDYGWDDEDED